MAEPTSEAVGDAAIERATEPQPVPEEQAVECAPGDEMMPDLNAQGGIELEAEDSLELRQEHGAEGMEMPPEEGDRVSDITPDSEGYGEPDGRALAEPDAESIAAEEPKAAAEAAGEAVAEHEAEVEAETDAEPEEETTTEPEIEAEADAAEPTENFNPTTEEEKWKFATAMFNETSASKAVDYMQEHGLVEPTAAGVARVFRARAGKAEKGKLSKFEIGEYLAKNKDFNKGVLHRDFRLQWNVFRHSIARLSHDF
eukprot:SAG11_NODE_7939_length_1079_cov_1.144898_2_plen_256_part_00